MAYYPSKEFLLRVENGEVAGYSIVRKFGAAASIGTSWTPVAAGQIYRTPTTATALEVVSSSADDTNSGGSGIRTVTIEGTGSDWRFQRETVEMNGTTAVDLTNTWTRVFRLYAASSGSYATQSTPSHASTVTLREDGGGDTWGQIGAISGFGLGQSAIGAYTIPKGYTASILDITIITEATKTVNVGFFQRVEADTVSAPYAPMRIQELYRSLGAGQYTDLSRGPLGPYTGPTDIGFLAQSDGGGGTTADVSVYFTVLLRENGQ